MTPNSPCPECGKHVFNFTMGQLICIACHHRFSPIQHMIAEYTLKREKRGDFVVPTPAKALMFAVSEMGEVFDAYLRGVGDDGFIRNNDRQTNFAEEIGDVLMMLLMASWLLDIQIEPAMWRKFDREINNAETNSK